MTFGTEIRQVDTLKALLARKTTLAAAITAIAIGAWLSTEQKPEFATLSDSAVHADAITWNNDSTRIPETAALLSSEGGQWSQPIDWPLVPVSMSNLPDGRIMTWSGSERGSWPTSEQNYSAIWDPKTGEFTERFSIGHNMFCAATTMTADGKVFVNGGRNQGNSRWTSLFDWRSNDWQQIENMASGGRWYPTTLQLPDGDMYTTMGSSTMRERGERWNAQGGWQVQTGVNWNELVMDPYGSHGERAWWPILNIAPSGNIFHAGPTPGMNWINPNGNGSVQQTSVNQTEWYPKHSAVVMYDEGKLLIAGGWKSGGNIESDNRAMTVDINSATPIIEYTGSMQYARKFHNGVVLPTGEVAVFGGNTTGRKFSDAGATKAVEIWNPQSKQWRTGAEAAIPRTYHSTALMMTDGRVLSAGGGYSSPNHFDGEVWSPPYLFNADGSAAQRPSIESAPESIEVGGYFDVQTNENIDYFSMIKLSSTTHGMNTDLRFLRLDASSQSDTQYRVTAHSNANVMTPGYWMLFAVDYSGVPSEAHVVKVQSVDSLFDNLALQGIASQSSNYIDNIASRATDGNTNGQFNDDSVTHTNADANSWWELDLEQVAYVESIRLWNRTDCCSDRLSNFYVFASEQPFTSQNLQETLVQPGVRVIHHAGQAQASSDFDIGQEARYIRVQLNNTNFLQLAEVQVFGLPGSGSTLEAMDTLSVAQRDGTSWRSIRFQDEFLNTPVVIAGPAADNDLDPVSVRLRNSASYGFEIKVDEWDHQDGSHSEENLSFMALSTGRHSLGGVTAEAGHGLVDNNWKRIDFAQPFGSVPVVLSQVASEVASASVVARVRNISTTGFDVRLQESAASDGIHSRETVNYIALSQGAGLYDGKAFNVGTAQAGASWSSVNLGQAYYQPGFLASMQSTLDATPAAVRYRSLSGNSVQLMVQNETSQGATQNHGSENIGWLVFETDTTFVASVATSAPAPSGQSVAFSATPSTAAGVTYSWNFGDGSSTVTSTSPTANHNYNAPGRYVVTMTLKDANGDTNSTSFTQAIHAPLQAGSAKSSSTIIAFNARAWNVNPDNDSVSISTLMGLEDEIAVGKAPWSLAARSDNQQVWVTNKDDASISVINAANQNVVAVYPLPVGSQPHGIVFAKDNNSVWVALEALGQVLQINSSGQTMKTVDVGSRPRHLSLDAAGTTLLVSRYITPALPGENTANPVLSQGNTFNGGEVVALNTANGAIRRTYVLRHSNRNASESTGPGLPNYLGAAVFSPDGESAWVPSKQDNIMAGTLRGNGVLTFDQSVRAISSRIDLGANTEDFESRIDHDNASLASHAVFDATGMHLFTALEGNRQIAISDPINTTEIMRINVGRAPQGLALSADGKELYVHNFMDRSISVLDVSSTVTNGGLNIQISATHSTVRDEELSDVILRGKQLFYDSQDDRLALQDYMSCASCHNEADHDGRTWDFTQMGEGLRNTTSLRGKGAPANGRFHWSANFDEIQDFEAQIRDFSGGTGLMDNTAFNARRDSLGLHKAGQSADLDAIATYLASLRTVPSNPNGSIDDNAAAKRGQSLFTQKSCDTCHAGQAMTDSIDEILHDVGTIKASSGKRLGQALTGIDTPSLLGLFETAPYLHDGSAATISGAISAHTSATSSQASDLAAYLARIPADGDDALSVVPLPKDTPAQGLVPKDGWVFYKFTTTATDSAITLRLSDLTADIDLYIRAGEKPSGHVSNSGVYDGFSAAGGTTTESVTLSNTGATSWYVGVHGYEAGDYQLLLSVTQGSTGGSTSSGELVSAVASNSSVGLKQWHHYTIDASSSHTKLEVSLSGLAADSDLYLRHDQRASGHIGENGIYDCSSTFGGSTAERCVVDNPNSGTWHVSIYGYEASPYTLKATLTENVGGGGGGNTTDTLLSNTSPASGTVAQGAWSYFRYVTPADATQVRFDLSELQDDVDLYVRAGERPSGHYEDGGVFDCQSIRGGRSDEDCTLSNSGETTWYVGVYGYRSSSFDLNVAHRTSTSQSGGILTSGAVASGNLVRGEWRHYTFTSTATDRQISAELSGLGGDVDIFVRAGERPSDHSGNNGIYDCGSIRGGSAEESCILNNDAVTTWHISLYAYDNSPFELVLNARENRSLSGSKGSKFKEELPNKEVIAQESTTTTTSSNVQVGGGGVGGPAGLALLLFAAMSRRQRRLH